MPRLNRYETEFAVNGSRYVAQFEHNHFSPFAVLSSRGEKVVHRTRCRILNLAEIDDNFDPVVFGTGEANCSIRDVYNWRIGIKLAFERALRCQLDPVRDRGTWGEFHAGFFKELRCK